MAAWCQKLRRHRLNNINPVIDQALKEADNIKDVDLIGVTSGPGLVGAHLVDLQQPKVWLYFKETLIGVHHRDHVSTIYIEHKERASIWRWWYQVVIQALSMWRIIIAAVLRAQERCG